MGAPAGPRYLSARHREGKVFGTASWGPEARESSANGRRLFGPFIQSRSPAPASAYRSNASRWWIAFWRFSVPLVLASGNRRFESMADADLAEVRSAASTLSLRYEADLAKLPALVRKWLRHARFVGHEGDDGSSTQRGRMATVTCSTLSRNAIASSRLRDWLLENDPESFRVLECLRIPTRSAITSRNAAAKSRAWRRVEHRSAGTKGC